LAHYNSMQIRFWACKHDSSKSPRNEVWCKSQTSTLRMGSSL